MVHEGRSGFEVPTSDGRVLSVETSGDSDGFPVVLMHGTPGSRNGPKPRFSVLYRLGVRLITYDRPGYGGSSRSPGRKVVDAAADVLTIMDYLGIDEFSVVGRSGGGPHALACAARCPSRVKRVAALVSVAPANAAELDWFAGMTEANVDEYTVADTDLVELSKRLQAVANRTRENPESILDDLSLQLSTADRNIVRGVQWRRLLATTYAEALRHGAGGWVDDVMALRSDWGFDLRSIRTPVLLWHGQEDNLSPVSHTRWLADQIANVTVCVQPGAAHFGAVEVLPDILPWLTGAIDDPVPVSVSARC